MSRNHIMLLFLVVVATMVSEGDAWFKPHNLIKDLNKGTKHVNLHNALSGRYGKRSVDRIYQDDYENGDNDVYRLVEKRQPFPQ